MHMEMEYGLTGHFPVILYDIISVTSKYIF